MLNLNTDGVYKTSSTFNKYYIESPELQNILRFSFPGKTFQNYVLLKAFIISKSFWTIFFSQQVNNQLFVAILCILNWLMSVQTSHPRPPCLPLPSHSVDVEDSLFPIGCQHIQCNDLLGYTLFFIAIRIRVKG